MLVEFTIENFRSIKEDVTFSFLASSDDLLPDNIIHTTALHKNDNLLKTAVIYGANASGKSNVINALDLLKDMVLNSIKNQDGDLIPYYPFKLDDEYLNKPTKFRIIFIHDAIRYVYSLSFTSKKIITESLHYYPNNKKAVIFERYENGKRFTKDKKIQNEIYNRTLSNVLYLSNSAQQNYQKTLPVFKWFKDYLRIFDATETLQFVHNTIDLINKNENYKRLIVTKLITADFGINDVSTKDVEFPIDLKESFNLNTITNSFSKKRGSLFLRRKDDKLALTDIKVTHSISGINKPISAEFDFYEEESEGTKRFFYLIGPLVDSIENGRTIIIDEFDLKLHPLLTEYLIKLFHDPVENRSNAQLLFTTHNVNLLNKKIFRRDQIWFTEKSPNSGNTDLYSLTEFSPRNDENILKGYLAGRYGAIPFINS